MKKVTLFLSVIGATLLMTSCLGEGSNNYTDQGFVYINEDDRYTPYGTAINPQYLSVRLITSNSLTTMNVGDIKYMAFSWDEANGSTPVSINGQSAVADNVHLLTEPVDISKTYLQLNQLEIEDDPATFDEIVNPIYSPDRNLIGDYWIFQYVYTAKKGQNARVEFFKRDELNENGEIVIDVQLTLTGTPEDETAKQVVDAIAVDMSPLRNLNPVGGTDAKEELKIRFNYYQLVNKELKEVSLPSIEQPALSWVLSSES